MLFLSHCAYEIAKSDLKKQTQLPRIRLYTIFPTDHLAVFLGHCIKKYFLLRKITNNVVLKKSNLLQISSCPYGFGNTVQQIKFHVKTFGFTCATFDHIFLWTQKSFITSFSLRSQSLALILVLKKSKIASRPLFCVFVRPPIEMYTESNPNLIRA